MPDPDVTVILCVHNGAAHLNEAIWSVRRQTYPHWHLLVVDDGSRDTSVSIARAHAAQDARITVLEQANAGVRASRNTALRVARTRWVALLDHDDAYMSDKLERQMAFLAARPDVAALGTHGVRVGLTGRRLGVFDVGPRDDAHYRQLRDAGSVMFLLAASVVFDRDLALRVGGFPPLEAAEDVGLWSLMADHAPVLALPERLVAYRVHAGSTSSRKLRTQRLELEFIRHGNAARRAGRDPGTLADFLRAWHDRPAPERRAFERETASLNAYRVAGGLLADRRPAGLLWLARSVLLNPRARLQRVVTQLDLRRPRPART